MPIAGFVQAKLVWPKATKCQTIPFVDSVLAFGATFAWDKVGHLKNPARQYAKPTQQSAAMKSQATRWVGLMATISSV